MSKIPRLPSTCSELQGVHVVAEYACAQFSHVYLPYTCDIPHVITYARPSSRLFHFWGRGPGDKAGG